MSTSQSDAKHDGFSKVLSRMKTVLRRDPSTKATPAVARETPAQVQPESSKAPTQSKPTVEPTETAPEPITLSNWGAIQEEKARALFAKYGLTLEPGEWKAARDVPVQRVVKPIRMRVRRTCHRCQTTYGPDRVCVNCQHVRCKKCPRYPAPKPKDEQERTETALQTILAQKAQPVQPKPREHQLTLPSRTGGQDLIRKPIRQRVRRTCHRCNTLFAPHATECASCRHLRCKICPRDPAKHDKYPDGYPGDAEPPFEPPARTWKKPRQRVRYTCHECSTVYRSGQKNCANCGQEKCAETIRDPCVPLPANMYTFGF
ncbi:uncharacterized protein DSM5745_08442 [Aspergillus mulundensis]|uniref:Uncharacterized protein n=1 Tax=Aspergillus mulundensis TaxID=1810919 RepID=A0A3D8QM14_9EURO|nr:Uncharacterized protein DSM5745_09987 [Aspergillus mulundensis]XP_026601462.1 Uncharacterized protein DSM5745_08442 [Aspergillus mulundensis]RDW62876.1 Uncharacterized protein DSM5745_09987 [Aspergillus mulundensis]RDW70931.1 Uncharacterized protein DSM5745_08442 [Aspergillus mulundensis]